MASSCGGSLVTAFDFVWDRFTSRLEGLTDDEYFWLPAPATYSCGRLERSGRVGAGPRIRRDDEP